MVGFPGTYKLLEFGEAVSHAFGHIPYTLGQEMTGLPIDFQIQQLSYANEHEGGNPRSALYAFHVNRSPVIRFPG